jgi:hypothetical protein
MSLVTLEQAKRHLRIDVPTTPTPDPLDADLEMKMAAAEAIVLDYIGQLNVSPPAWVDETDCPPIIQAAILMQTAELWRFRGDDPGTVVSAPARADAGSLSPMIEGMLRRYRDPALA